MTNREYQRAWYRKNRLKKTLKVRQWQALNKERVLGYKRKWNKANAEYYRQAYLDRALKSTCESK